MACIISFSNVLKDSQPETANPHICAECRKKFSSKHALNLHMSCHFQETFICDICTSDFKSREELTSHIEIHEKQVCFMCDQVCQGRAELAEHQRKFHKLAKSSISIRKRAKLRKNRRKAHRCKSCDKEFGSKRDLIRHMSLCGAEDSVIQCSLCDQTFAEVQKFQKHCQTHMQKKLFPCAYCHVSCSTKLSLQSHLLTTHCKAETHTCFVCDREFSSRRALRAHSAEHLPGQSSTCDICGKVFPTPKKLQLHFMVHTNERPYTCRLCSRGFSYHSHLRRHMLWHSGERPHVCGVCNTSFIANFLLQKHMRTFHMSDANQ